MKPKEFIIAFVVILVGAALVAAVMMTPPEQGVDPARETDVFKFRNDYVHVFHDDKRGTTCYVLNGSISCVKDASSLYEDLYR